MKARRGGYRTAHTGTPRLYSLDCVYWLVVGSYITASYMPAPYAHIAFSASCSGLGQPLSLCHQLLVLTPATELSICTLLHATGAGALSAVGNVGRNCCSHRLLAGPVLTITTSACFSQYPLNARVNNCPFSAPFS